MRFLGSAVVALMAFALIMSPPATAQRGGLARAGVAPHLTNAPHNPRSGSSASGLGVRNFGRRSYAYGTPYASLPFPFFADALEGDDIYSTGYPVASQPPPYLMQAMQGMAERQERTAAASLRDDRASSSPPPLMIELQNGRYVQVSSPAADGEAHEISHAAIAVTPTKVQGPAKASPPATLIFRDGHSEEVRDYTIASGVLYARGNFYTDGYWNKKVDLASIDVTRTEQANAERNVKFDLPQSANEVITRF